MEDHSSLQVTSRKRRNETVEFSIANRVVNPPIHPIASNSAAAKIQVKVRIKRFHGVAFWTWGANTKDDVCSICQNAFEGVCPGVKFPGEDCPVVWGKCQHAFHLQCINTWLTSSSTTASTTIKNSCPICRQEWEFSSSSPANAAGTSSTDG